MNSNNGGYQPISFDDDVEIGPQQGLSEGKVLRVIDSSAPNSEIRFDNEPQIGPQQDLSEGKVLRVIDSSAPNSEIRFDNEPQIPAENEEHIYFFGCCCDFRRAILSLSLVSIILRLLIMLGTFLYTLYVSEKRAEVAAMVDDDGIKYGLEHGIAMESIMIMEILVDLAMALIIIFDVIGIYGALKFKRWAIITSLTFYSIFLVLSVFILDLINGIICGIYVYAYISMLKLMTKGIMIDENYHKIAGCCGKK